MGRRSLGITVSGVERTGRGVVEVGRRGGGGRGGWRESRWDVGIGVVGEVDGVSGYGDREDGGEGGQASQRLTRSRGAERSTRERRKKIEIE